MSDGERLERLERNVAVLMQDVSVLKQDVTVLKQDVADIKGTLARLEPMIIRILSESAETRGQLRDAPTARDFGRLEGRVDALESRLPVTLAYQPPQPRPA